MLITSIDQPRKSKDSTAESKNLFDLYVVIAQIFPAIISLVPVIVLWFYISQYQDYKDLISFVLSTKMFAGVTVTIALLYLYTQILRLLSKYFQNRYFLADRGFPTTYLMSYSDKLYTDAYKGVYRDRVRNLFGIAMPSKNDERNNPPEARLLLDEAARLVLQKVRNRGLVRTHNIWYGFFRNLVGGSMAALLYSIIDIIVAFLVIKSSIMAYSSIALVILYLGILLFHKKILIHNAEGFAKQVLDEFMAY